MNQDGKQQDRLIGSVQLEHVCVLVDEVHLLQQKFCKTYKEIAIVEKTNPTDKNQR